MRCTSCNRDTPGRNLKPEYRCPVCGHQFVAIKKKDGLSDLNIKQAISQVSNLDKLYYSSDHVSYQLHRRLARNRRATRASLLVTAIVFAIGGALLLALRFWVVGCLVLIAAWFCLRSRKKVEGTDVFALVSRFEAVNPPNRPMPRPEELVERERGRDQMLAALRGASRVLVCQHRRDAAFLVANDFHLHHACPVAGPDGLALDGFPELDARLKKPGTLDLFVLHDFTPGGSAFMRNVRTRSGIGQRRDAVKVIDMGLIEQQRPLLATALRPLERIPLSRDPRPEAQWPDEMGTQVAAMRPAVLLAAAGRSIEERAPMRAPARDDDDGDRIGSTDSDADDSE